MLISRTCFGADKEYCKMMVDAGYTAVDINDTSHKPEIFLASEKEQYDFVKNAVDNILSVGLKIGQCHAPHSISLWCSTNEELEQRIVSIENCVKTVSKFNIPYTVIHPLFMPLIKRQRTKKNYGNLTLIPFVAFVKVLRALQFALKICLV